MNTQSILLTSFTGKPIATDLRFLPNKIKKPILVFSHGFKGFKDWGHFPIIAERFAREGFFVVSFNFSHNGTSPLQLQDFADAEAFGNNNYSIQLDDLGVVLNFILNSKDYEDEVDGQKLYLWGHSIGAGISLLKAAEDSRVKKVLAWASVGNTLKRVTMYDPQEWKSKGVTYITNARTGQQLPIYYQFYTDFFEHQQRLDLEEAASRINVPVQFIHGNEDEAVSIAEVTGLHEKLPMSNLKIITEAGHTFGGKHPWNSVALPKHTEEALALSLEFLKK
ncbi:alpha/beta hydrolase family protein [Solitalea koreensis]|uniref:Dienelactone hydrolase family protein n=1 Tax=Solitalea koreensis TaxID=543615 RepID=A0A521E525_9SPHI|nr:alpha/beta fold hydrolase [Solitalea koreensis]SMO79054.1 Dienelactone hydrolase family protein [Solitalea koreensis]